MNHPTFSRRQLAQLVAGAAVTPAIATASANSDKGFWPHRTGVHRQNEQSPSPKLERVLVDQYWLQEEDDRGMMSGVLMGVYLYPDGHTEEHQVPSVIRRRRSPETNCCKPGCFDGKVTVTIVE